MEEGRVVRVDVYYVGSLDSSFCVFDRAQEQFRHRWRVLGPARSISFTLRTLVMNERGVTSRHPYDLMD